MASPLTGWSLIELIPIRRELEQPFAQQILEGRIPDGASVHVTARDKGLVIGEVAPALAVWAAAHPSEARRSPRLFFRAKGQRVRARH